MDGIIVLKEFTTLRCLEDVHGNPGWMCMYGERMLVRVLSLLAFWDGAAGGLF